MKRVLVIILMLIAVCDLPTNSIQNLPKEKETVRVIYTNDTRGYLEPCGCGGNFDGGFARRATAIARLKTENPNCLIIDSGNLADAEGNLDIVIKLMTELGYTATGLGAFDLKMIDPVLVAAKASGLTVIDPIGKQDGLVPFITKTINGVRIGVVSCRANFQGDYKAEDLQALGAALKKAREQSDVLILLDQGAATQSDVWINEVASGFGRPDIVIGGIYGAVLQEPRYVGKTVIVPTSCQGKKIGVIDISLDAKKIPEITVQMVAVDKNMPEDEKIRDEIGRFLNMPRRVVAATSTSAGQPAAALAAAYHYPQQCKQCHASIYNDWAKTKHAAAVQTLTSKNRVIPECLPCHSEEFRSRGIVMVGSTNPMGVECATCHASIVPHGSKGPAAGVSTKVDKKICVSCHTPDRSANYNEAAYMEKVSHKGVKAHASK